MYPEAGSRMQPHDRLQRFRTLEAGVHALAERHGKLRVERDDLKGKLLEREAELRELRKRVKEMTKQRDAVRKRLDGLLGDLEQLTG